MPIPFSTTFGTLPSEVGLHKTEFCSMIERHVAQSARTCSEAVAIMQIVAKLLRGDFGW